MIQIPCRGGCGKIIPGSTIHCGNPDCQWKSYNKVEDAKVNKNGRAQAKPTTVHFPKAALIDAYRQVAQARRKAA